MATGNYVATPKGAITIEVLGPNTSGINEYKVCNPTTKVRGKINSETKTVYWQYAGPVNENGQRMVVEYAFVTLEPDECTTIAVGSLDEHGFAFMAADYSGGTGGGTYIVP